MSKKVVVLSFFGGKASRLAYNAFGSLESIAAVPDWFQQAHYNDKGPQPPTNETDLGLVTQHFVPQPWPWQQLMFHSRRSRVGFN